MYSAYYTITYITNRRTRWFTLRKKKIKKRKDERPTYLSLPTYRPTNLPTYTVYIYIYILQNSSLLHIFLSPKRLLNKNSSKKYTYNSSQITIYMCVDNTVLCTLLLLFIRCSFCCIVWVCWDMFFVDFRNQVITTVRRFQKLKIEVCTF